MRSIALLPAHPAWGLRLPIDRLDRWGAEALAFALVFAAVLFLPQILNDGDTLWQIRTGEWILTHGAVPATDPFSFSAGDRPWFAHEWLAETLMALAHAAGGMAGVMGLAAASSALTAALVLRHLRRFMPGLYAVLGLAVALANAAPSLLARPHVLAWPCLVLWCAGLAIARSRRTAPSFWLLAAMILWVNLHGSFMLGLLLPVAFGLEALFDPGADRRQVVRDWGGFALAAWVAALLNPEFLGGLLFPFQMLGMKSLAWIGEWRPTDFSRPQPLELMILAGLALGLSGRVTLPPMRLAMLLGLIHGALSHTRNEQLLGLVGALVLAEPLGLSLGRGMARPMTAIRPWIAGALACTILVLGFRFAIPLPPERTGAAFAAVLARVPDLLRSQPVLNDYALGGALIFQGVRPFIDSRADLYGDAFLSRYRIATAPDLKAFRRLVHEHGIAWTIFAADHPIVPVLSREPGWRLLTDFDGVAIHVFEGHIREDAAAH